MNKLSKSKIENRNVLLRVDLNVPISRRKIRDESKIISILPTIKLLLANNNKIIICSHLGRPKGTIDNDLSLKPIAKRISQLLDNIEIDMINLPLININEILLKKSKVFMLENIRFDKREVLNLESLSIELSKIADTYINDAFASSHRKHASTYGVTKFLPSYAGLLMEKEIDSLSEVFSKDYSKKVAIVGGAKVSDKIKLIKNLSKNFDVVIIGGGMITAFVEENHSDFEFAKEIISSSKAQIIIPEYVVIGEKFNENTDHKIIKTSDINKYKDKIILDISRDSFKKISGHISQSDIIIWNGPVGVFEWKKFSKGTLCLLDLLKNSPAKKIVGGGSTAEIIYKTSSQKYFTHVSTGGGATLEFLEGKKLPGIEALHEK